MTLASLRRLVSILLGAILLPIVPAEAGTFKNPALINTTYDPIGVATADFSHDGNLDLAYIDGLAAPVLHLLLGNGDGTFAHGQNIPLPAGICGYANCVINLADVTHDGNLDIALGGSGSNTTQLAVFPGNGDGTFQAAVITTLSGGSGNYPMLNGQMGIGDINGDGSMDLVVADRTRNQLDILLGNNTGRFTLNSATIIYFTGQPMVYLHDLNGDGKLDIVAIDRPAGGVAHVLLGKGNGTFQQSVDYSYLPLFLADMDSDGHPDLVCEQYGQGITVAKGNPDGTFGAPSLVASVPPNANLATIADYNGDGIPDLVFLTPVGIAAVLGRGNLTYSAPISTVAGVLSNPFFPPADLAAGDFDNNGHNDLAMGVDGGVLILLGNGNGSFASADFYDVGQTVGTAAVADFDGDGRADVAVTVPAPYPRLLLGTGSGGLNLGPDQNQSYTSQTPAGTIRVADFNGDGRPDLLEPSGSNPAGQSVVLSNLGSDKFSAPLGVNGGDILTADLNSDGRGDLVFLSEGTITAMLGQANSTFTAVTTPLRYASYGVAAVGDLNHDGKPDLLVFEFPNLRIWLGNGDGTFMEPTLLDLGGQVAVTTQSVAVADIDSDGNNDLVISPDPNPAASFEPLLILYGNGDGTFQGPSTIPVSHRYGLISVADVNRDNKPDLVLTDSSGIAVITNLGNRTFSAEDHYVAGQGISQLNVVDVNRDGFPDIVAANSSGTTVTVLLNQPTGKPLDGAVSIGAFTVVPAPSNYSRPVTLKVVMSAPAGANTPTPTGSVTFYVDGSYITDVSLASGTASFVYSPALLPGAHTFVAAYNGDSIYSAESFAVFQAVNPPVYATMTALSAVPATVLTSQTVRLTATVTSSVTVPAGWVTFLDGANSLGAQPVDSTGVALLDTATLTAGAHQISAVYRGYQDTGDLHQIYRPSTSSAVTVNVNAIPTATAISTATLSPTIGAVITITATVTSGSTIPFGGVSVYDGSVLLGTAALTAGAATFSTASLSTGSHSISGTFNANATFAASSSPVLNITVAAASLRLARSLLTVNLQDSGNGKPALKAKVIPGNGSAMAAVTFLDGGDILGTSIPDGSGAAVLLTSSLPSGVHTLSASFSGDSQFAPAVSPEFVEQWPPSGPGFSIELPHDSMSVTAAHSEQLPIRIKPIGDFQQLVQFACGVGVPSGYACVFSPSSLSGGGISYLTLQPTEKSLTSTPGGSLYGIVLGFFALFTIRGRGRRLRCLLSLSIGLSLTLTGCGNPPQHVEQPQLQVLSIRATSGSGSGLIVHSAEAIVKILPEK